ncbi:MAG: hypothetical protein ACYCW6_28890 [Candidatus Xenobia bacterium]
MVEQPGSQHASSIEEEDDGITIGDLHPDALETQYDSLLHQAGEGKAPPAETCQRLAEQMQQMLLRLHRTQPALLQALQH